MAILSNIWDIEVDPDFRFDPDLWSGSNLKIRIYLNISKLKKGNFTLVSIAFKFNPTESMVKISSNLHDIWSSNDNFKS